MSKFREVLSDKRFFCFWMGQIISQFGDRLNQMALIVLVHGRSGTSAFELAKIMAVTIIPSFLISPIAGAYVDRWNRKYTMIIADLLRAVLVAIIPLIVLKCSSFVPVYVTVFLVFSISCFFIPSKLSIIPELVGKEKLLIANSLTNTTVMIAAVLGVGCGGFLIERVGAKVGFYIDAATYVISALLLCFIRISNSHMKKNGINPETDIKRPSSVLRDIREGMRYVVVHPYVRFVFFTIFVLMAAAGAVYIVGIIFIQNIFGSITKDLGVLSVFLGGGFFIGALVCGHLGQALSKTRLMFISLIATGLSIAGFIAVLKVSASLHAAMGLAVLIGISVGPVFISGNTLIHEVIKTEMRGRIFSSLGIVMNLGFLIAMFIASKVSDYISPGRIIIAISGILVLYGIVGMARVDFKR
jgi:Arabinose efflux permease